MCSSPREHVGSISRRISGACSVVMPSRARALRMPMRLNERCRWRPSNSNTEPSPGSGDGLPKRAATSIGSFGIAFEEQAVGSSQDKYSAKSHRSSISTMPKNTCGMWLMRSWAAGQLWERPGLPKGARCSNRERLKLWWPRSRRYRPFRRNQGKRAVVPSAPWTILPPTRRACAIPSCVLKECTWAAARL